MPDSDVSVIIPCHDDGRYLSVALDSVFKQTAKGVDIIVVDDGSSDLETRKLLDDLASDSRLTILHNPVCRGPAAARNLAISRSRGRYVLPLDADDRIMPEYIEKARVLLDTNDKLEIVYCQARLFGLAFGEWRLPPFRPESFVLENVIFATAMFRRSTWEKVGGYSENMTEGMEDYDFWLKIVGRGGGVHRINEFLFDYRVKPNSRTARLKNEKRAVELRAFQRLFENNQELFCRPENVRTLYFSLHKRMRTERDQRSSILWRCLFRYIVRLELWAQTGLKWLLGRA